MPVIVVGADTPLGGQVLSALASRDGEVRAFVTNGADATDLRQAGVRVAVGDVSDASHVAGAALDCFTAVLLTDAAFDDRERSFAPDGAAVLAAWDTALVEARVRRAIWVGAVPSAGSTVSDSVVVEIGDRSPITIAAEIAELDDRPDGFPDAP